MNEQRIPIHRALVSVHDKSGLDELAQALAAAEVDIVSTGSTADCIASFGHHVTRVEQLTGFAECLDGRVKTLHPRIHAGLLADRDLAHHREQLAQLGIGAFDLLVSNFYPFAEAVASGADARECVEKIDIGGPTMVRAAAKNHTNVAVVVSPTAYPSIMSALRDGGFTLRERRGLAASAFAEIAAYDVAIAQWYAQELAPAEDGWPDFSGSARSKVEALRYGENPHQRAALYAAVGATAGLAQAGRLGGRQMSYNNYVDADAAWRACHDFAAAAVVIVKHTNPCGIAVGADIAEAHRRAYACDPTSAYGGVVAANSTVTLAMAQQVSEVFTEVIVAPSYAEGALDVLSTKKNLRILQVPPWRPSDVEFRQISGGVLAQTVDRLDATGDEPSNWRLATGSAGSEQTMADLEFAWRAVRSVKSNAILLATEGASVGIGMGQVNRVDSARLAVARAGDRAKGSVAASDAFFPFADGLRILLDAGVTAVVAPGGSVRDEEVAAAAAAARATLYLTGTRHFYH